MANITGKYNLANFGIYPYCKAEFHLSAVDTDADAAYIPDAVSVVIGSDGSIDAELWENDNGSRGTVYANHVVVYADSSYQREVKRIGMGKIVVIGDAEIQDLLVTNVVPSTQEDALALAQAAAASAALDRVATGEDRAAAEDARGGAEQARDQAQTAAAALGLITLVYAGDSIAASSTAGLTVSLDESVSEFNPRLSLATVVNTAVGGARLDSTLVGLAANPADLVQRYASYVYPHRPSATGHAQAILIISVGANDFGPAAANDTVRQAWIDAYTAYVEQAVSDGFTVVGMTIMRRLMSEYERSDTTETRLIWNDAIRRCKALSGVVDLAEFFDPETDAELFIDNTHPGDAGIPIMAGMVSRQIDALGQTPKYDLPPATGAVTLPAAAISELERAAITFDNHTGTPQVLASALTTAVGTGDFTFSAWVYPRPDDVSNKVILSDGTNTFSAANDGYGYIRPIMVGANIGAGNLAPIGKWAHLVARRASGVLTYWVNGKQVHWYVNGTITRSISYPTSLGAMTQINRGATSGKFARIRQWSRALTDAEIAADYAGLSPVWDDDALFSALADGSDCIWPQFNDLVGPDFVALNTYPQIPRPAQSAVRRFTTTGNATVLICPQGHTIEKWIAKVSVAGGGNLDIGLTNNGGQFFDAPLVVGEHDLALLTRTMANSNGAAYINAAGYTIEHVIRVSA